MAGGWLIALPRKRRCATGPEEAGGQEEHAPDANGEGDGDQDESGTAPEGTAPPLEQDESEGDEPGDLGGPTVQGEVTCLLHAIPEGNFGVVKHMVHLLDGLLP